MVGMKVCSIRGCGKEMHARLLCNTHYHRERKYGTPFPVHQCLGCGKKFKDSGVLQMFCSKDCPSLFIYRKCEVCRVEFSWPKAWERLKGRGSERFCGRYCRSLWNSNAGMQMTNKERDLAFKNARKNEIQRHRSKKRYGIVKNGDKIDPFIIYEIFDWKCIVCDSEIDSSLAHPDPRSVSLDHVVPLSCGGTHTWHNVAPAHLECNLDKKDSLDEMLVDKLVYVWKGLVEHRNRRRQ